ncbi:hypothetical protein [Sphingomonas aracearum]|uniref:Uncharacterized protein n=1 Tax=Sphingomonas aracearum TaxID=2283317 RepID=A0A369VYJ1_9SPHN|nr:hypothetical protein [Sphingomonas aracearum]RDE07378.1 hypothetical protein DVW87_07095 [Sphingomonas aracearum]
MTSSGSMTNWLDRLEKAKLSCRRRNPADGRGVLVANGLAVTGYR